MSFEIPLRPGYWQNPSRADLIQVEAAMLWPDDAEGRLHGVGVGTILCALGQRDQVSKEEALQLCEVALGMPPLSDIKVRAGLRQVYGAVAAAMLEEAVAGHRFGVATRSMTEIVNSICERVRPAAEAFRRAQIMPKSVWNTIWPNFRSVAHLWAAHHGAARDGRETAWPCSVGRLPEFLAEAEAWRALGEQVRPKGSKGPILAPGGAVAVPEADRLPATSIELVPAIHSQ